MAIAFSKTLALPMEGDGNQHNALRKTTIHYVHKNVNQFC